MTAELKTVVVTVADLAASKATYAVLFGVEPIADSAYYVGFELDGLHFGLAPQHGAAPTGAVNFWSVADLEVARDALLAAGATERDPIREVGGGRRVAVLADTEGNPIGLMHDA